MGGKTFVDELGQSNAVREGFAEEVRFGEEVRMFEIKTDRRAISWVLEVYTINTAI